MCDRYREPTGAELAEAYRDPAPREVMATCAHQEACEHAASELCLGGEPLGERWGASREEALERAARWLHCDECPAWKEMER